MPEKEPASNESLPNLETADLERVVDRLSHRHEIGQATPEESREERVEAAREVLKSQAEVAKPEEKAPLLKAHPSSLDKFTSYRQTMASLSRRLSPASRTFSRTIHMPAIEKTSEVLEVTLMRPSVTLGATLTCLVVGGFFFFSARAYGFPLKGSEFVLSLLVGAMIGLTVEVLFKLLKAALHRH